MLPIATNGKGEELKQCRQELVGLIHLKGHMRKNNIMITRQIHESM